MHTKLYCTSKEIPSLNYLKHLSNGNEKFEGRIIQILVNELPEELENYKNAVKLENYYWAAEIVHKINHKIAFFHMKESYSLTCEHESSLREGKLTHQEEFLEIVIKILKFLPPCSI